jgi:hypothetical protein
MIGKRALKTCTVCRDKIRFARLQPLSLASSSRKGITTSTRIRNLDKSGRSIKDDIDDSVFTSLRSRSSDHTYPGDLARGITEEGEVDEEWVPREERRSPAAVFGSKRIGLEVIPRRLEENIQLEITSTSPYLLS